MSTFQAKTSLLHGPPILMAHWEAALPTAQGNVVFSTSDLSVNVHTITLVVQDEIEAECTANLQYTVGTPPEITHETPVDGSVFSTNEDIAFQVTLSDLQDTPDQLNIAWESNIDGLLSTNPPDSGGMVSFTSALTAGPHNISLTATDTDGLSSSHSFGLYVSTPPTAPSLTLTPDPAYTTNDLMVAASGSNDVDGDPITYGYEWFADGVLTPYTSTTIAAADTDVAKNGLCRSPPTMVTLTEPTVKPPLSSQIQTPS